MLWTRLSVAVLSLTVGAVLSHGQDAVSQGFPEDWSSHHLIYADPGNFADAVRTNTVDRWISINRDFRYLSQQLRRQALPASLIRTPARPVHSPRPGGDGTIGDWSMLPGQGAVGKPGVFPAKFGFDATVASCTDFVVFPSGVAGSSTVPSIVGYYNLYSGCSGSGAVPNVQWAANVNAGQVVTSPVLSIDGTQVAFIATMGTTANLVILNMPSSSTTIVSQVTTNSSTVNAATPCTAPCANWIALNGSPQDTTSSPFYDYLNNVIYVGDSKGVLHKFQNVFAHYLNGATNTTAPGEVTTSPWPVTVVSGKALTSPVYDAGGSGKIFVGTGTGNTLAAITASSGTVVQTAQIAFGTVGANTDPLVDSTAQKVYIGLSHGNATTTATGDQKAPYIYQFPTTFTASALPSGAVLISSGANVFSDSQTVYSPAFDNAYYSGGTQTGNLYACGLNSSKFPELYRIPITSGTLGTATAGPVLSTSSGTCSPLTEVYNGSIDYVFLSQSGTNVTATPISCPSGTGCIMSFNVTSGSQTFNTSAPVTTAHALEASGTSGIIIDNTVSSPTGTSQVYFSVLGSQSCSRTITGSDTKNSSTVTATTGIFTAGDLNGSITGGGVSGDTITAVGSTSSITVNKKSTSTDTDVSMTVTATGGCAIQASQALLQ